MRNSVSKRILVMIMTVMLVTSMSSPLAFAVEGTDDGKVTQSGITAQAEGEDASQTTEELAGTDDEKGSEASSDAEETNGSNEKKGNESSVNDEVTEDQESKDKNSEAADPEDVDAAVEAPEHVESDVEKKLELKAASNAAEAGVYYIHLAVQGKGYAEFYDLNVRVEDAEGNIVWDGTPAFEDYNNTLKAICDSAPAKLEISCMYKYPDDTTYENITFETDFVEFCVDEDAVGTTSTGEERLFCTYSIEKGGNGEDEKGLPAIYNDLDGNNQIIENCFEYQGGGIGSGWYIIRNDTYTEDPVSVDQNADANLILGDDTHSAFMETLFLQNGSKLTIWGQSAQTGYLYCEGTYTIGHGMADKGTAGIEVLDSFYEVGHWKGATLIINGGEIKAETEVYEKEEGFATNRYGSGAAGIHVHPDSELIINKGTVTAKGSWKFTDLSPGPGGAAIGGNMGEDCGKITINGGIVNATSIVNAAGIGGGGGGYDGDQKKDIRGGDSGEITINGGRVTAMGGQHGGAGIGGGNLGTNGPITINGGVVKASHYSKGPKRDAKLEEMIKNGTGIGAGAGRDQGGDITIGGECYVIAEGCRGAGIGGGGHTSADDNAYSPGYSGRKITIKNYATVIATSDTGAGIGGGGGGAGTDGGGASNQITIGEKPTDDIKVLAMSTKKGAGIGGGNDGKGGHIVINGGKVTATGGNTSRGVLQDIWKNFNEAINSKAPAAYNAGSIVGAIINQIRVSGEWAGAGIGGGDDESGGTVEINGGTVIACGGKNDTTRAIGFGDGSSDNGSLTIYNHSKTTYGHLGKDNNKDKVIEDETVYGPTEGVKKAQSNTYARIEPGTITVTFDLNGHGGPPIEAKSVTYGSRVSYPSPDPADEEWFFTGWYKDRENTELFDFGTHIMEPTTIYAGWIKKKSITVEKKWVDASGNDITTGIPEKIDVTYWVDNVVNEDIAEDAHYKELNLNASNNWSGSITISDEARISMLEPEVDGFRTDSYVLHGNIDGEDAQVVLPVKSNGSGTFLNLRSLKASGLSETDYEKAKQILAAGNAVIRITNSKERVYSVKKVWDLPDSQDSYKCDVTAVLQHNENGKWKTLQKVGIRKGSEDAVSFSPVTDDGKSAFDDYRIRELDKDGNIIEGGAEHDTAVLHVDGTTAEGLDASFKVTYQDDPDSTLTTITNKSEGTVYSVKLKWLDYNGKEDAEKPENVDIYLFTAEPTQDGKKHLIVAYGDSKLTLNEENDWQGSFAGRMDEADYEIREDADGATIYVSGDEVPSYALLPEGKAQYKVRKDGVVRTYQYDVTLEVDDKTHTTTITNKRTGIVFSARKEWSEQENNGWPGNSRLWSENIYTVYAVLQHRAANGSWQDAGTAIALSDSTNFKNDFGAVALSDDFDISDYRVREFIEHRYNKDDPYGMPGPYWHTITFFDPADDLEERNIPGGTGRGRLLLAESDEDNVSNKAPVFNARHKYYDSGEDKISNTGFSASYQIDENGIFVITNTQEDMISVHKNWLTDHEDHIPVNTRVVLQHKETNGNGDSWVTVGDAVELNKENDWYHYFRIGDYGIENPKEEDFRVRELKPGAKDNSDIIEEGAEAEFDVTIDGKNESIPYKVSYKQEGSSTTIANTDQTKTITIEKSWDIDLENQDKPGSIQAVVQEKKDDKWVTVAGVSLNDENNWKGKALVRKDAGDLRVRELRKEGAISEFMNGLKRSIDGGASEFTNLQQQLTHSEYVNYLPDNVEAALNTRYEDFCKSLNATEENLYDKLMDMLELSYKPEQRIVYDEKDKDKPEEASANSVTYHVDEYLSVLTGKTETAHNTRYMVSYGDDGDEYTIKNKAVIEIDVIKRWLAVGVKEEDMPDSAWVVLMCKPKEGALENAKNIPGVGKITDVLDYEFPVLNPIKGGIDPLNLISQLTIGLNVEKITKIVNSVASIFGIEWIIPTFAIGKVNKDNGWKYTVIDSKYHMGIPMEYRGAELAAELIAQIVKYITHGLYTPSVSFDPFKGFISISTKAVRTFLGIENVSDIFDGKALDRLKDIGRNITMDEIRDFGPESLLDDDKMMANVINVKIDIPGPDPDGSITLRGSKTWKGDEESKRPDQIILHVKKNGEEFEGSTITLNKADNAGKSEWKWELKIEHPDLFADYTVTEEYPSDYQYKNNYVSTTEGLYITNTWTDIPDPGPGPETITITGHKVWRDNSNIDGRRPDKITVYLLADNQKVSSVETSRAGDWRFSFPDMPKTDDSGKTINYRVSEAPVKNYVTSVTNSGNDYTIINTYRPTNIDVKVKKVWKDANDEDGIRPESVEVKLLADNIDTGETITLSKDNGWSGSFEDLPALESGSSRRIVYTVEETSPEDTSTEEASSVVTGIDGPGTYRSDISGDAEKGFTITNTHTPRISIKGSKTWNDDNDRDRLRPNHITIYLMADGERADSCTVTAANDWKWEFNDLLKYRANGEEIKYTISEDPVSGYTAEVNGYNVINTHDPEKTDIIVNKAWSDDSDSAGKRPKNITFRLYADGTEVDVKTVEVSDTNSQKIIFRGKPKYRSGGKEISYTVKEDPVAEYTAYSTDMNGFNIVNRYTPSKTSVSVRKVWDDADNQDGIRPAKVTVKLLNDGVNTGKTIDLTESGNWSGSFTDLEQGTYTVSEETVSGYSASVTGDQDNGYTITNKHDPETKNISVKKVWDDSDDLDLKRPESVTLRLRADGREVQSATITGDTGSWSHTFNNVPVYKDGQKISYTISEDAVAGYTTDVSGDADGGFTITNSYTPETPENIQVNVFKVWIDDNDRDGIRPHSVTVRLYCIKDGRRFYTGEALTLTEAGGWKGTFSSVNKKDLGNYYVEEDSVNGYNASYMGDEEQGFVVFNSRNPETETIKVKKVWDDNNDQDGERPDSVTVHLLANGRETATKTLTASDGWEGSFEDVFVFGNGRRISYTVSEDAVKNYSSSVSGNDTDGFLITNRHIPDKTQVNVTKLWLDADDQDGIRPEKVTVHLFADGDDTGKKLELSANNQWQGSFDGLDLKKDGRDIRYTVTEDAVDGYDPVQIGSAEFGYMLCNIHTPSTKRVEVTKHWDDQGYDNNRPESITFHLKADGREVDRATVKAEDNWHCVFGNLAVYENGRKISYTVSEDAVDKYTTLISRDASSGSGDDGTEKFIITNKYVPTKTQVYVNNIWADSDDQDGQRKYGKELTVHLLADGVDTGEELVLSENNNWQGVFADLPKKNAQDRDIVYTVTQDPVISYTTKVLGSAENGFTLLNILIPETVDIKVSTVWDDSDDQDGVRPKDVKLRLKANGREAASAIVRASEGWQYTFRDIYRYEKGEPVTYEVVQETLDGYETSYSNHGLLEFTIINKHVPETISLSGSKTWDDEENADRSRPLVIKIRLRADGAEVDSKIVTALNGWKWSFNDLPKYSSGHEIVYTITEDAVDDYTSTVAGMDVTNKYTPGKKQVNVTKVWEDENDHDGIRPESVTIKLLANGIDTGKTLELNAGNKWTGSFNGLDKIIDDKVVRYSIEEVKTKVISGTDGDGTYASKISGNEKKGYTITNTHTPWYTITYKLNGGKYNGSTADITERHRAGSKISIHEAPARKGYKFLYWKGSEYQPGDSYTVTEDHTFTAQWKKNSKPGDSDDPDNPNKSAKTGDDNRLGLWFLTFLASLLGLAEAVIIRKRKTRM